jgi:hypothetical protein
MHTHARTHARTHTHIPRMQTLKFWGADAVASPGDDALDVGWFTRDEVEQQTFGLVGAGVLQVR